MVLVVCQDARRGTVDARTDMRSALTDVDTEEKEKMDTSTLIIVVVVLLVLFGGGGFYWRGRRQ